MSLIRVDIAARRLTIGGMEIPCAIGRGGACPASAKREGDGCTPVGTWPVRGILLRPGRVPDDVRPQAPWRWTRADDGWSDDPADPAYNRPVILPRATSAETLQREDHAYDVIVVLGHNDAPPVPGAGSAIFFHIWVEGRPTEGCVAVARDDMLRILPMLTPGSTLEIR
ncbi:L,D-transpeptidase family protein [Sphingobium aquiterrae]|uniref:L,D-transpeptidase family protein n=1 Tax=Sphingobium aquiterrae TaxID=2038656 RepID=UPI00301831F4